MKPISYRCHRFPPQIIQHTIWLYCRFTLSFRDVEDLLAERGLDVSYWLRSSKIPMTRDCHPWRARPLGCWLSSSVLLRPGSRSWRRRFGHGTDPTRRAAVLRRSPAVSSPRRRWWRRSEMARSSDQVGSSQPGSVYRRFKSVFPLQHRGRPYMTIPNRASMDREQRQFPWREFSLP